ncbi:GFA family protein [Thermomonas sp. S9]|uniref:GFA family protein n=1 Tax=Thermomonas sp. S9 TaxID=2885203 RepID=UPI00216AE367|nr:GFA family protein [Thermomonas sp. S9]MCR6494872.1 GFA family protein [Thermomonas sp. S9]
MHTGSCLCGSVRYTVDGALGPLVFCHCARCRKANGTAFLAAVTVEPATFTVSDPHARLASHESSSGVFRKFCGHCGSPLFSHRPGPPEVIRLRPGMLDSAFAGPVTAHIFHRDRAAWLDGADHAPTYDERP